MVEREKRMSMTNVEHLAFKEMRRWERKRAQEEVRRREQEQARF